MSLFYHSLPHLVSFSTRKSSLQLHLMVMVTVMKGAQHFCSVNKHTGYTGVMRRKSNRGWTANGGYKQWGIQAMGDTSNGDDVIAGGTKEGGHTLGCQGETKAIALYLTRCRKVGVAAVYELQCSVHQLQMLLHHYLVPVSCPRTTFCCQLQQ